MSFGGLILTNDGRNMMAACVGEKQILNITHVELGEGVYTGSYLNIKKLKNPVMRIPVSRVTREDNKITIECDYYHKDAPHGFYFREIGLIGNDTLLYYDNAGEGDADYIDPDSKVLSREKRLRFVIALTDDVNITIETLSGLYALQKDLDVIQEGLDTHVNDKDIHITAQERIKWNKNLPSDGDSKNNTVTFSSAKERTNIENGDNHATLFGKIKRWFADLKVIAFTGNYDDLNNTPTIPNAVAVKGDKEDTYRTGEVNLTPEDIGAVNNAGDTMTGELYNTYGSKDGRKTSVSAKGFSNYMPADGGYAGGVRWYKGDSKEENRNDYVKEFGYLNIDDIFYMGESFEKPNGVLKLLKLIGNLEGTATRAVNDVFDSPIVYTYFRRQTTSINNTTDWNSITDIGCYSVDISPWGDATKNHSPNSYLPTLHSYGLLFVFSAGDRLIQLYVPYNTSDTLKGRQVVVRWRGGDMIWKNWISLPSSGLDGDGNSISETYLKNSGGKITGNLKLDKGYMVHQADNARGTIGYLHICQIKVVEQYIDMPIAFKIFQRGRVGELFVKFAAINNNDPALDWFIKRGNIYAYIVKSATSTWDIYIAKGQSGYDSCEIVELNHPYSDYIQLTWKDATVTSLPSGYREATLDVYSTNITGSATKLATPRQIALSGAVTGSVNFDGSGNATIATLRREANICKETDANQVWFKFASHTCGANYTDCSITFLVSAGYGDASLRVGILTAHFRTSGDGVVETRELVWNFANININPDDFILAYNGSNKPATVELWAKLDGNYKGYSFEVLAEKYRTNSANIFTLYDTRQGTNAITSGYTQVKSYLAVIKNTAYASVRDGDGNAIVNTYQTKIIKSMSGYHSDLNTNITNSDNEYDIVDILKGHDKAIGTANTEIEKSKKAPIKIMNAKLTFSSGSAEKVESKSFKNIECILNNLFPNKTILNISLNTIGSILDKDKFVYSILGYNVENSSSGRVFVYLTIYNMTNYTGTFSNNFIPVIVTYIDNDDIA